MHDAFLFTESYTSLTNSYLNTSSTSHLVCLPFLNPMETFLVQSPAKLTMTKKLVRKLRTFFSVFLFRSAHRMQVELNTEDHDEDDELGISMSQCCLSMFRTWLPLLCRASNGIDTPILSSSERTEMVGVLEEMIQKLSLEQQEEVLGIWLHHFTACPDSDWPNLESSYTRWYAQSRKLLLQ